MTMNLATGDLAAQVAALMARVETLEHGQDALDRGLASSHPAACIRPRTSSTESGLRSTRPITSRPSSATRSWRKSRPGGAVSKPPGCESSAAVRHERGEHRPVL
jgi:hypothetical protein